jgi:diaminopimelate decarboxylase
MGIDVVSSGEIFTAKKAGFPLEKAYFHSNNKTNDDILFAIKCGVGHFVVDNVEELYAINTIGEQQGVTPKVLLRITPGVDPHTFEAVATGKVDSKFGSAIETGQAIDITRVALNLKNTELVGFHCHVGSQVFESGVYFSTIEIMLNFVKEVYNTLGFKTKKLDLGGGLGVRYVETDPSIDHYTVMCEICNFIKDTVKSLGISLPVICFEPGRSIVANAGMTAYTVGTVKRIPGYKSYVSVDGGMTDSPRFILYGAKYTFLLANKMNENCDDTVSVVGRCCESGDILGEGVSISKSVCRGDILAQLTTGAYHYSMASNYNRIPRPPVVMLNGGESYIAVKRESLEDLTSLDI